MISVFAKMLLPVRGAALAACPGMPLGVHARVSLHGYLSQKCHKIENKITGISPGPTYLGCYHHDYELALLNDVSEWFGPNNSPQK